MKLVVSKSPWEIYGDPLEGSLDRIQADGYDAVEIYLIDRPEPPARVNALLRATGLPVIAQIGTQGATIEEHLDSLELRYEHGLHASPIFFNCHTGRDHFSFADNLRLFERGAELSARHGVPICHETHRGRALFNAPLAVRFLQALPELRLTADLAHWFCVHESDLRDQKASLDLVLERSDHVHARVGYNEGAQVSDPRNPHYRGWVERNLELWRQVFERAKAQGRERWTITPEFGPLDYMPLSGANPEPVSDAWEINLWVRDLVRREFGGGGRD